jgi:hypothetical protein
VLGGETMETSVEDGAGSFFSNLFLPPPGRVAGRKRFVTSYSRFRLDYAGNSFRSEYRVMYRLNHNQDVIELLLKLRDYDEPYPVRLFTARRLSFIALISRCIHAFVRV